MERTSRELVRDTLEFKNTDGRVPRQLWTLPWADLYHHDALQKILDDFTWDFAGPQTVYEKRPKTEGDPYTPGLYIDEWGSRFTNIQPGVFGEVKDPLVQDDDWEDAYKIHIPEEFLSFDMEKVNADCAATDKFMMADCCPRPFEQLQFLRGTANLYMDLMDPSEENAGIHGEDARLLLPAADKVGADRRGRPGHHGRLGLPEVSAHQPQALGYLL